MCVGIPGRIIDIVDERTHLATVEIGGIRRTINIACVLGDGRTPADCVGKWVLVHVGFAMSLIDEEEAAKTLALLRELGEIAEPGRVMQDEGGHAGARPRRTGRA